MTDLDGITLNGYKFQNELGAGGFGAVYLAYQPHLKRDVYNYPHCQDHKNVKRSS